jgi:hypothetical protein
MTGVLAIPSAISLMRQQLVGGVVSPGDVALPLRALQMRGVSITDLTVHIERIRAVNDAGEQSAQVEENCLLALEVAHGSLQGFGLSWDAPTRAASLLGRYLDADGLESALPFALEPSDLLPPRCSPGMPERFNKVLVSAVAGAVENFRLVPQKADLVRAPKSPFTSRPATVLAFPDRLALEALMTPVEAALQAALPASVVWPRHRSAARARSFSDTILGWDSPYVVKADIAHFYESVEHSVLAVFLATRLRLNLLNARAIEALLTATMGLPRGLPQGPLASDIAASAYLLPVDQELAVAGQTYVRYADDYYFPARDVGHGRSIINQVEAWLTELGLSLNSEKTAVMKRETFEDNLERPAVREFKQAAAESHLATLDDVADQSEAEAILAAVGLSEEVVWDLMYHHTVTVDELVGSVVGESGQSLPRAYQVYFGAVALHLRNGSQPDNLAPLSSLAKECLAVLATRTDHHLELEDIGEVQTWFPHLAPDIVRYLLPRLENSDVAAYLRNQVSTLTGIDWVDAWMCHASGRIPAENAPLDQLHETLNSPHAGPLTRVEALRSLTDLGATNEAEWRSTLETASSALASEILFADLSREDPLPWLQRYAREAEHPAIAAIAGALTTGEDSE